MFESLGNVGDFVGGIGVIITVIYLAFQIRQSTASTKKRFVSGCRFGHLRLESVNWIGPRCRANDANRNPRPRSIRSRRIQYEMQLISVTRNFENIHYQYKCGGIPETAWSGWSYRIVSFFATPGVKAWWPEHKRGYSSDFIEFVESGRDLYAENPMLLGR